MTDSKPDAPETTRVPAAFREFSARYPKLAESWSLMREAEGGPIDPKTSRMVKLGIAIACRSEGATHSGVRKALAAGVTPDEIYQVVALAASTVGLPNAVAAFTWVEDELRPEEGS